MTESQSPKEKSWRHWLAVSVIVVAYGFVATRNIDLPGIYADSINPDYLVNRILNPDAARSIVWVLFGNSLLGDRAPVLISLYHGSQHFWLGLPLYALFGTTVEGVRLVHATFALGLLLSMYLLVQRVTTPWLAAVACMALAVDPSFAFSFRTQGYITVAPAAWMFLGLWCLVRAASASGKPAMRWLFASSALYGLACVGYFVWTFFLPPLAFAATRWMRGVALPRPAWRISIGGLVAGSFAYPLGYFLVARKAGSFERAFATFEQLLHGAAPLRSQQSALGRATYVENTFVSVLDGSWHSAMMFNGDAITVPGFAWKFALVVALQILLWAAAEIRRSATPMQRLLVVLPLSFAGFAFVFGDRLGGHHYGVLVPILYAGLAVGLHSLIRTERRWTPVGLAIPIIALAFLNATAQSAFQERLVSTGGKGLLSDAIHRLAADINGAQPKPLLWFPDAVLALPLIMLTHGAIEMSDQLDDLEPKRRLCDGKDVWLVRIPRHASSERGERWLANLGWSTPPATQVYSERGGAPVFEVLRFHGDATACTAQRS